MGWREGERERGREGESPEAMVNHSLQEIPEPLCALMKGFGAAQRPENQRQRLGSRRNKCRI